MSADCATLVNELEVTDEVRFTGYVAELPAQLAAFDVVAAPSENEAFSLALAEAMAAGCAVIAARGWRHGGDGRGWRDRIARCAG